MKSAASCIEKSVLQSLPAHLVTNQPKRLLLDRLQNIKHGELTLKDGEEIHIFGQRDEIFPGSITVNVSDPAFYASVLINGAMGGGQSYIHNHWQCDDLTGMVELFLCNREHIDGTGALTRWLFIKPYNVLQRVMRRNTLKGSRRNIEAHYDLGNELFELFLDETMMYSCGIFNNPQATLQEASEAKLACICNKLQLKATDHVLEIGTGWGGFAIYAATHYGCRITTTTISGQQYEYACQRVREAGLEDRITLLLEDYRDLEGSYDKLVSIEMIEAIGHRYFDTYFRKCNRLLRPDGMMLLQSITISDQRYPAARNSIDFIQRYIFPGGCLPCLSVLSDSVARMTDMRVLHMEDIGLHYATTLRHWKHRFRANLDRVRQLGYPEHFIRMWEYYLSYCEGGFRQGAIGTAQLLLTKPMAARESGQHRYY